MNMINKISNKSDYQKNVPKEYLEVAQKMEADFVNHMLNEMRQTAKVTDEDDSTAMNYYNSLLDTERADIMAKHDGGIGLQKMILDQIYPEHMRKKSLSAYKERTHEQ